MQTTTAMKTTLATKRCNTVLLFVGFIFLLSCASVGTSTLEQDDSYFSSKDRQLAKEAAAKALAIEQAAEQAAKNADKQVQSQPDYVNPDFKSSGKIGQNQNNNSGNGQSQNSNDWNYSNYSSPYYSNSYCGGYSWVPGPFSTFGPTYAMSYPGWQSSGWGTSIILGTRPYNPWIGNMGYGFNNSFGYYSFGYNAFGNDPFWGPSFGYYGYNPFSPYYYSPYSNFGYNPFWNSQQFIPVTGNNEPIPASRVVKTNLPMSGMNGIPNTVQGGRSATVPTGGRPNGDQNVGGQPVVVNPGSGDNNPNNPSENPDRDNRYNSSIFRSESPQNKTQIVNPNTNPNTGRQPSQSDLFRSSPPDNDFFNSNRNNSGFGSSSGTTGGSRGASGGRSGGGAPTGGRRR
jgi:hypothetical protein